MMRITSNTLATQLSDDLTRLSSTQTRYTQQLASGRRLFDASDDVPATGRVMSYDSEKRALQQYERNSLRGLTTIAVGTASLESINKIANQIFNIAPAATASGDASQIDAFGSQIDGLIEQTVSQLNTQISGTYIFGSRRTDTPPFTVTRNADGQIDTVSYVGDNAAAPTISVSESADVATTTRGTENIQLRDFLNNLVALRQAVDDLSTATTANNQAGMAAARAAITTRQNTLGDDEDSITTMLSTLSISQLRIKTSQEQNSTRFNQLADLSDSETEINTADIAIQLQASNRAYESALKAGANLLQKSLLDYL